MKINELLDVFFTKSEREELELRAGNASQTPIVYILSQYKLGRARENVGFVPECGYGWGTEKKASQEDISSFSMPDSLKGAFGVAGPLGMMGAMNDADRENYEVIKEFAPSLALNPVELRSQLDRMQRIDDVPAGAVGGPRARGLSSAKRRANHGVGVGAGAVVAGRLHSTKSTVESAIDEVVEKEANRRSLRTFAEECASAPIAVVYPEFLRLVGWIAGRQNPDAGDEVVEKIVELALDLALPMFKRTIEDAKDKFLKDQQKAIKAGETLPDGAVLGAAPEPDLSGVWVSPSEVSAPFYIYARCGGTINGSTPEYLGEALAVLHDVLASTFFRVPLMEDGSAILSKDLHPMIRHATPEFDAEREEIATIMADVRRAKRVEEDQFYAATSIEFGGREQVLARPLTPPLANPRAFEVKDRDGVRVGITEYVNSPPANGHEHTSVVDLVGNVRFSNALTASGIETVGHLVKLTEKQLREVPQLGSKGVTHILSALSKAGLKLEAEQPAEEAAAPREMEEAAAAPPAPVAAAPVEPPAPVPVASAQVEPPAPASPPSPPAPPTPAPSPEPEAKKGGIDDEDFGKVLDYMRGAIDGLEAKLEQPEVRARELNWSSRLAASFSGKAVTEIKASVRAQFPEMSSPPTAKEAAEVIRHMLSDVASGAPKTPGQDARMRELSALSGESAVWAAVEFPRRKLGMTYQDMSRFQAEGYLTLLKVTVDKLVREREDGEVDDPWSAPAPNPNVPSTSLTDDVFGD